MRRKIEDLLGLDAQTMRMDYQKSGSLRCLARKYGITRKTIANMLNRLGIEYDHNKKNKLFVNERYFANSNDPNVLYWLGFLLADGCVYKNYLKLGLAKKDLAHLELFKKDLDSKHKISKIKSKKSHINKKWKDTIINTLAICSKKMVNDVRKYGIVPRKTFITQFPKQFINNSQVNIYCRGYFDGDGCWSLHKAKSRPNHSPQLTFSLRGTKEFLYIFNKVMVKEANLPKRCFKRKISASGGIGSLTYIGNRICACIARWLYSDIIYGKSNRYLARKFNIIEPFLSMKKSPINF